MSADSTHEIGKLSFIDKASSKLILTVGASTLGKVEAGGGLRKLAASAQAAAWAAEAACFGGQVQKHYNWQLREVQAASSCRDLFSTVNSGAEVSDVRSAKTRAAEGAVVNGAAN